MELVLLTVLLKDISCHGGYTNQSLFMDINHLKVQCNRIDCSHNLGKTSNTLTTGIILTDK